MRQSVFTVIADIEPGAVPALRATLDTMRSDPAGNPLLPFAPFEMLHFASLVLATGPGLDPPKLIFESNVDGTAEDWFATLAATAPAGLDSLYAGSPGYPGSGDPEQLRAWLGARVVRPGAYHIGATGRSVQRIRQEQRLHQAIEDFLDAEEGAGRLGSVAPRDLRASIQAMVRADPSLGWALVNPGPRETARDRIRYRAKAVALVVAAVILSPVLVPVLLVAAAALLIKERVDRVQKDPPDPAHVRLLENDEDEHLVAQNHLSSVIPVKPGVLRSLLLPAVLYVVNLGARITATKGKLGGIPSIHFAHWSVINGGSHLMFLSNFDGSWESYLGDFIDKAAKGLTAVWSNTVDFPRTQLLAFKGAADGPWFRKWARSSQCRTEVWYRAYPKASMAVVDNNSSIREDLFRRLDAKEVTTWLRRL